MTIVVLSNTRNIAAVSNRQAMIKSCQSASVIYQESNHMILCKGVNGSMRNDDNVTSKE